MRSARNRVLLAVNIVALALVLVWIRENISPAEVLAQIERIPARAILITLLLNIGVLGVYGMRLALLLRARQLQSLAIVTIGFGLNGMLPFRLGEIAKLAYARQLFGIAPPRLIAVTAVEKLMDLCALALIGVIASQLIVAPYLGQGTKLALTLIGAVLIAFVAGYALLARRERAGHRTHHWITGAFETLREQKGTAQLLRLVVLTSLIWTITVASIYAMFGAVFPAVSIADALAISLVLALAIAIPGAPAGLGAVEAAIVAYLHQNLNADPNQALASALAFHFIVAIPQIMATVGILFGMLWRKRILHRSP